MTNVHAWFVIEFRKGIEEHVMLLNLDNVQDAFKLVKRIGANHNERRFNVEMTLKQEEVQQINSQIPINRTTDQS